MRFHCIKVKGCACAPGKGRICAFTLLLKKVYVKSHYRKEGKGRGCKKEKGKIPKTLLKT